MFFSLEYAPVVSMHTASRWDEFALPAQNIKLASFTDVAATARSYAFDTAFPGTVTPVPAVNPPSTVSVTPSGAVCVSSPRYAIPSSLVAVVGCPLIVPTVATRECRRTNEPSNRMQSFLNIHHQKIQYHICLRMRA